MSYKFRQYCVYLCCIGIPVISSADIVDFKPFDNQVALGVNMVSANNAGQLSEGFSGNISVSRLTDGGFFYNGAYSFGGSSNFTNNFGYAISLGQYMQITPGGTLKIGHVNSSSAGLENNTDIYSQQLGFRYEVKPNNNLNVYGLASYGLAEQSTNSSPLGYSEGYILGLGLTYRPMVDVPWVVNTSYAYNGYASSSLSSSNQLMLSTGYAF